ncbi:putative FAD dependent oxidoreductase [Pleurostoma richardsiae]|uniref:FAD dependent oxidoreductase n=1 Tax=Pleurostoma richardsiae TaxID=41990 RepID=A0AA38R6N8_9PEZI|nr:putative FAD dependent oxidoreductase [Pleurostoma richardsiae]
MPLVCVLGSGIIGLASATLLADAGYEVVVVARDLPGDPGGLSWASPSAGAVILPSHNAQDPQIQTDSLRYYWALAHRDPASGVQVLKATEYYDPMTDDSDFWYKRAWPHYRRLPASELPEGVTLGFSLMTCAVNPTIILPYLQSQLEARGVRFVRFVAESLSQVLSVTGAKVLVNATGLGAKNLAVDNAVTAVRGQTMFVRERDDLNEIILRQGSEYTYVIPRLFSGGVIIGGSRQPGNFSTVPNKDLKRDILRRVNRLTKNAFKDVNPDTDVDDIVGFRPGREGGFRLETEGQNIVHAYGFDGMGYVHSFGAAKRVTDLVGQLLGGKSKL